MIELTRQIKVSEDGITVDTYDPGHHDDLSPAVLEHARNVGAITEKQKQAPANKAKKTPENKAGK